MKRCRQHISYKTIGLEWYEQSPIHFVLFLHNEHCHRNCPAAVVSVYCIVSILTVHGIELSNFPSLPEASVSGCGAEPLPAASCSNCLQTSLYSKIHNNNLRSHSNVRGLSGNLSDLTVASSRYDIDT